MVARSATILLAAVAALLSVGCNDPYATAPKPGSQDPPPGELPAPPITAPEERVNPRRLAPTAHAAARHAADLVGNWTAETAAARYAQLAASSTGQARAAARTAAAQLSTDPQLTAPGASGSSTIEAIVSRGTGARRRLIIVTRERVQTDGHTDSRWRITLAQAQRLPAGWALSKWEPQP